MAPVRGPAARRHHHEHARPGSDIVAEQPASVRSGKSWQEIAAEGEARNDQ